MIKHLFIRLIAIVFLFCGVDNCFALSRYFTFDKGVLTDSLLIELCEEVIYPITKENNVNWKSLVLCVTEENAKDIVVSLEAGLNVLTYYNNNQADMDYVIVPVKDMDVQVYLPKHYGLVKKTGGKKVVEDYHYDDTLLIVSDWRVYWAFEVVDGRCQLKEIYDSSEDFLRRYSYQTLLPPSLRMKKLDDSIRLPREIFEILPPPKYKASTTVVNFTRD